jgi:Asp-tRNA(Asn)/Glu-tRNA(Gln) amidotransferase A subunit family amidase
MLSAIDIAQRIAQGQTSVEAELLAALDRIAAQDRTIHAFTTTASRDALVTEAGKATGPLAGIAVGVKDIFDTADLPTRYGSPIFKDYQPLVDAAIVAQARRAGAAIIGKTVTTEYAWFTPGPTVNPHNPDHTPGGSSSGSAAAVASGMIAASIGTQTGGSVIRPASFCGVAGYKPGFKLFPATGMKTFSWSLDTPGFFAATVADVAFIAAALSGRDLAVGPLAAPVRVGLYRSAVWSEASTEMAHALESAADVWARAGAQVVEIQEPELLQAARDAHSTIQNYEAALALASDLDRFGEQLSPPLRQLLSESRNISTDEYDQARRTARRARGESRQMFDTVDVFLTPSAPGAAPLGLDTTGSPVFNKLWTLIGNPCVNVPGKCDSTGMPLGLQIVGKFGRDRATLAAAAQLESCLRHTLIN